jgi:hypothetical protein
VVSAHGAGTDSWSEYTVGWGSAPPYYPAALASAAANDDGYYEFDITDFVRKQVGEDDILTLVLVEPNGQNSGFIFNSRESATKKPELILENTILSLYGARIGIDKAEPVESVAKSELYPNPVRRDFTVKLSDLHSDVNSLQLTSMAGVSYPVDYATSLVSPNELNIRIPPTPEGQYFLKIQSEAHQEVIRMLVIDGIK